jgi:two-component system, NtrC family, response regulator HydG
MDRARRLQVARSGPQDEGPADEFPEIDGTSVEVRRLKRQMWCVARDPDVTVLLAGESGTGKERIARAIHRASPRAGAPFVVIDCAGLSATLAEDTLFGHVRGAFTGAIDERPGPFERASGGTILLDEIGDLPPELQMKLLRAIQSRTIQRLGARQETAFDVRIIAATNVDLAAARTKGRFREDLYYRLRVYEITVPPLRRRSAADIRTLVTTILQRFAHRRRIAAPVIDPTAMDLLLRYTWPGNVRELENTLERMLVAAAGGQLLSVSHLPDHLGAIGPLSAAPRAIGLSAIRIREALERNAFKLGRTAVDLGLSRHQLYRLVKRHGIRRGDDRA